MLRYIPGQSTLIQGTTLVDSSEQVPPCTSSVSLARVLVCWPAPHVVEQVPLTQAAHTQSTKMMYIY